MKESIPKELKESVWNRQYRGQEVGLCCACRRVHIMSSSFHCGHILAESRGGPMNILNLLPICADCNRHNGKQYMPDFVMASFNRDLFVEIDDEMADYQRKVQITVKYGNEVDKKIKTYGNFLVAESTPQPFLDPIEPVFEYLIKRGCIDPSWTDESYKEFVESKYDKDSPNYDYLCEIETIKEDGSLQKTTQSNSKYYVRLKNVSIGGAIWEDIYLSYSHNFYEMVFRFTRAELGDFPRYYWEGWIYREKYPAYCKLTHHPIYVHRYKNYPIWD